MTFQEMLKYLLNQNQASVSAKILKQTDEAIDEVICDAEIDGDRYYLVRRRTQLENAAISLTIREQEIAQLIAEGLPNKIIGKRLGISPWTVATHLRRMFRKLGVKTRAALIARLIEGNLLFDSKNLR